MDRTGSIKYFTSAATQLATNRMELNNINRLQAYERIVNNPSVQDTKEIIALVNGLMDGMAYKILSKKVVNWHEKKLLADVVRKGASLVTHITNSHMLRAKPKKDRKLFTDMNWYENSVSEFEKLRKIEHDKKEKRKAGK